MDKLEGCARPQFLRPAVHVIRHTPARILHPFVRRTAIARLAQRGLPASVLFVCHGNICRSPFAAAVLRRVIHGVRVDSAGFLGPGRPSPPEAVAAAARHGVDLSVHLSQLVTAETARAADLIVVMDPAQRRAICDRFGRAVRDVLVLGDLDPQLIDARAIRDPVNAPRAVFEESYTRIERCVRELGRAIGGP